MKIITAAFAITILGCAQDLKQNQDSDGVQVPVGVYVNGVYHDVESDYIPHVVQCENGGAPLESLKAQAIATSAYSHDPTHLGAPSKRP